jgi:carbamate kinase
MRRRVVVALGGNAIAPAGRAGTAAEQTGNITRTMRALAGVLAEQPTDLVLTHGNGPQVGNLLIKNELARDVVPAVPLDWCVAQTQATTGFTIVDALEAALAAHGAPRPVVTLVSRVLVDPADPAFAEPTKPIGPWLDDAEEVERRRRAGVRFVAGGDGRWRRLVPSPRPLASLELEVVRRLVDDGAVVVANGGGGVPVVRGDDGVLHGVEAVIDKDLAGALLAEELGADVFAILTDVTGVAVGYGTPDERWLAEVGVGELAEHAAAGEFAAGSMGPKAEAARRFVERTGGRAVIASLDAAADALAGRAGTQVLPDPDRA